MTTTTLDLDKETTQAIDLLRDRLNRPLVDDLDEGDFAANLLEHLRTRRTPKLLFSPENATHIIQRCRELDPEEHAWEKRIADEAVSGRVYAASNAYCDRFVELDRETFDFSRYDHWDKEALHGLNRHRWYKSLARHYWEDQDSTYFDALMREWDFYAGKVPPPDEALLEKIHSIGPHGMTPPYHILDPAIRLTNWWWAYWLMLHAEEMTPERNAVLLARCLRLFDRVAARGVQNPQEHNFISMHMESLYFWAVSLPEVASMQVFRHLARNCLEASMARAVAEDGSHWEQSIGYHTGCIRWYGTSVLLARRNGQRFAEAYTDRLQRMGEYLDAVITPDGKTPLLSDSDRSGAWKLGLALLRSLFPDQQFRHDPGPTYDTLWFTDGYEWQPKPKPVEGPTVQTFPHGGIAVARPSRQDGEGGGAMLLLDNGPNQAGHAHKDNLNIHFEAMGRPILVDPGRWVYTPSPDRSWILNMPAHNTLYIEDEPYDSDRPLKHFDVAQSIARTEDPRLGGIEASQSEGLVRLTTSFKGYAADPDARVTRTLLMPLHEHPPWLAVLDRFEANQPHTWSNTWLLPASEPVREQSGGYTAALETGPQLNFAVAADAELRCRDDAMFWCPNYAEKSPARWVRFSSTGRTGQRAFLFAPAAEQGPMPGIKLQQNHATAVVGDRTIPLPPLP